MQHTTIKGQKMATNTHTHTHTHTFCKKKHSRKKTKLGKTRPKNTVKQHNFKKPRKAKTSQTKQNLWKTAPWISLGGQCQCPKPRKLKKNSRQRPTTTKHLKHCKTWPWNRPKTTPTHTFPFQNTNTTSIAKKRLLKAKTAPNRKKKGHWRRKQNKHCKNTLPSEANKMTAKNQNIAKNGTKTPPMMKSLPWNRKCKKWPLWRKKMPKKAKYTKNWKKTVHKRAYEILCP